MITHIFIIGSKGIPAQYGGFETFVDRLTKYKGSDNILYHVACAAERKSYNASQTEFKYHNALCFRIPWKNIGPSKAIIYDLNALEYAIRYIKRHQVVSPVVYILACRIGPFIGKYKRQLEALGGKLLVNPDGHEWKRAKWSWPVKKYWKWSERCMVRHADLVICDSKHIEQYIKTTYKQYNPKTIYIAYGADPKASRLDDTSEIVRNWLKSNHVRPGQYYLIVGRFVPENNFLTMIKEFIKSRTTRDLVLLTQIKGSKYYKTLMHKTKFNKDKRVKFVGTVYNQELLKKIREQAYAYLHGHEVGGTNPSLLEALSSTSLNLLLDVEFNREVALDSALYWNKKKGNLAHLIDSADRLSSASISSLGQKAQKRILDNYNWPFIVKQYETLFSRLKEEMTK